MNLLTTSRPPTSSSGALLLRRILAATDVAAVAVAWLSVVYGLDLGGPASPALPPSVWLVVATGVTAAVLSREQLYLTRVLDIRAVEVQRLGRACLIAAGVLVAIAGMLNAPLRWQQVVAGSLLSYILLLLSRGAVHAWRRQVRRRRDGGRSLLVVGEADDARRTLDLLRERPELGYRVLGYVSAGRPPGDVGVPWLGTPDDLAVVAQLTAATSVLVVAGALDAETLSATVPKLRVLDVHVHQVTNDTERRPSIRVLPLLHRSAPTGARPALSTSQRIFKRAFDVVAGTLLAVGAAPVVLLAAALLKVTAGGPVLVRDVGLDPRGEPLVVPRLRTSHLPPRRTARFVGRVCRRLCIDELPQLVNVLAGSMSLVGPRPHRPGQQVRDRPHTTAPVEVSAGLVGLRHVEACEYPEDGPHRRLDRFYAENWSVGLDLSILAASAAHLLGRTARQLVRGDEAEIRAAGAGG